MLSKLPVKNRCSEDTSVLSGLAVHGTVDAVDILLEAEDVGTRHIQ